MVGVQYAATAPREPKVVTGMAKIARAKSFKVCEVCKNHCLRFEYYSDPIFVLCVSNVQLPLQGCCTGVVRSAHYIYTAIRHNLC